MPYAQREFAAAVIRRHIDPRAEVALGMTLGAIAEVTACIDISDGWVSRRAAKRSGRHKP